MYTRGRSRPGGLFGIRKLGWLAVASMLALAMIGPGTGLVAAFNPGENGTPTSGDKTDLQGRGDDVTFNFQTNMTIDCESDGTAQQFNIKLDYSISGAALPAGSTLVVYLSPNNGAINNNAGGDAGRLHRDRRVEPGFDRHVGLERLRHAQHHHPGHLLVPAERRRCPGRHRR